MGSFTTTYDKIIRQPALTMPGNFTGSEAPCTAGNASSIRTLLSLATTSDVTFDIIRATTSVQTPLVNNASAALTLGNSTYGVTVPGPAHFGTGALYTANKAIFIEATGSNTSTNYAGMEIRATGASQYGPAIYLNGSAQTGGRHWAAVVAGGLDNLGTTGSLVFADTSYGAVLSITPSRVLTMDGAATFSGDISMSKTSAQGYIRAYYTDGVKNAALYHGGTNTHLTSSSGGVEINPASGNVLAYLAGSNATVRVLNTNGTMWAQVATDGTNSVFSSSTGNVVLSSAGGSIRTFGNDVWLQPVSGNAYVYTSGTNSAFQVYNSNATKHAQLTHDGTNGIVSTSSGNLNLVPTGGTVAVTGGITASGDFLINKTSAATVGLNSTSTSSYSAITFKENAIEKAYVEYVNSAYATAARQNYLELLNTVGGVSIWTNNTKQLDINTSGTAAFTGAISCAGITASGNVYCPNGSNYIRINTTSDNLEFFRSGIVQGYVKADTASAAVNISPGLTVTGGVAASSGIWTQGNLRSAGTASVSGGVGTLDLWSANGSGSFVAFSESGVANRGIFGFAGGSSTLSYRSGATSMATGTEVFTIGSTGNVSCVGGATITGGGVSSTGGLKVGSHSASVGAIWNSTLTPSTSNYALLATSANTYLNAPTAVALSVAGTDVLYSTATGLSVTPPITITGIQTGCVDKSANYTTTASDTLVNVTANSIDITFETAVGCAGREHRVFNSGAGTVTLKTTSAQTISGNASGTLTLAQYKAITVQSDGANWMILSQIA